MYTTSSSAFSLFGAGALSFHLPHSLCFFFLHSSLHHIVFWLISLQLSLGLPILRSLSVLSSMLSLFSVLLLSALQSTSRLFCIILTPIQFRSSYPSVSISSIFHVLITISSYQHVLAIWTQGPTTVILVQCRTPYLHGHNKTRFVSKIFLSNGYNYSRNVFTFTSHHPHKHHLVG